MSGRTLKIKIKKPVIPRLPEDAYMTILDSMTINEILDYRLVDRELADKYINSSRMNKKYLDLIMSEYSLAPLYKLYKHKILHKSVMKYLSGLSYFRVRNPIDELNIVHYINTKYKHMIDNIKNQAKDEGIEIVFNEVSGLEAMINMNLFKFMEKPFFIERYSLTQMLQGDDISNDDTCYAILYPNDY